METPNPAQQSNACAVDEVPLLTDVVACGVQAGAACPAEPRDSLVLPQEWLARRARTRDLLEVEIARLQAQMPGKPGKATSALRRVAQRKLELLISIYSKVVASPAFQWNPALTRG